LNQWWAVKQMLLVYPPWGVGGIKMNAESVLCQGKRRIRQP